MRTRRAVWSLARLFRYQAVRLGWSTSTCAGSSRRGIRSTTPAAGPPHPQLHQTVRRGEPAGCRAVGLAAQNRHRTPGGMLPLVTLHAQLPAGTALANTPLFPTGHLVSGEP